MDQNELQNIFKILSEQKVKYYDDEINTPTLKIIKAIVPYLNLESQKQLGIMIKIIEIQRLSEFYSNKKFDDTQNNFDDALINIMRAYLENIKKINHQRSVNNQFEPDTKKIMPEKKSNKIREQNMLNQEIFDDDAFKDLSEQDINFLKEFINDISGKTPLQAFFVLNKYNQKMPKTFGDKQKNALIKALIKKLPDEKQNQFFSLYTTFIDKK